VIFTVEIEEVQNEDGKEDKPILYFTNAEFKPLILNKTNATTLEEAFGSDSKNWEGNLIELYVDPNVSFGKKRLGGIRIRIPDTPEVEEVA
jgi:hypothetical protein